MASLWTPELRAKVSRLWEKHSDTVIARILWEEDRVSFSRNAVIGARYRMGMMGGTPYRDKEVAKRSYSKSSIGPIVQKINRARMEPKPKLVFQAPPAPELRIVGLAPRCEGLKITDLEGGECRWPVSDADGIHHFCGHPGAKAIDQSGRTVTHSYCSHHRGESIGPGTTSERAATRGIAA